MLINSPQNALFASLIVTHLDQTIFVMADLEKLKVFRGLKELAIAASVCTETFLSRGLMVEPVELLAAMEHFSSPKVMMKIQEESNQLSWSLSELD